MTSFSKSTVLGLSLGIFLAGYAVFAFNPPAQAPPAGNVAAPLNTGSSDQTKTGGLLNAFGLWVNQSLGVTGGATFGGIVNLQGNKVTNVGVPTSAGDVATKGFVDTQTSGLQKRVTGSCPGGQGVRAVATDGSVTCETIPKSNLRQGDSYLAGLNNVGYEWANVVGFSIPSSAIQWMTDFMVNTKQSSNQYCNSVDVRLLCNGNEIWSASYGTDSGMYYYRLGVYSKATDASVGCAFQAQRPSSCPSYAGLNISVRGTSPYME